MATIMIRLQKKDKDAFLSIIKSKYLTMTTILRLLVLKFIENPDEVLDYLLYTPKNKGE